MADTEFGTNDVQTVKLWSNKLARETLGRTYVGKMARTGGRGFITLAKDLQKAAGDHIKHHLHARAQGSGRYGSQQLRGFEEAMQFPQDTININQLRWGHSWDQMSQQRVTFDLREEAKESLSDWFVEAFETTAACKLAGTLGVAALQLPGFDVTFDGNALRAPTTDHRIQLGGASGAPFTADLIDKAVAMAKTLRPRIERVEIDGGKYYACLMTPEQVYQLRVATGDTNWKMIQARAAERGKDNPIFHDALGIWNDTILWEWEFLPKDLTAGAETCYAVFLGRDAGTLAFGGGRSGKTLGPQSGQLFSWVEEDEDYGDKMGVGGATIVGFQKNQFDHDADGTATDFAVIRIETESPAVTG